MVCYRVPMNLSDSLFKIQTVTFSPESFIRNRDQLIRAELPNLSKTILALIDFHKDGNTRRHVEHRKCLESFTR